VARVANKVVLLTGARAEAVQVCAQALIDEGASVALVDPDGAKSQQIAGTLKAPADRVMWLAKEDANEVAWETVIAAVEEHFGGLDVLVNGPPRVLAKSIADMSIDDLRAIEEANIVEPWLGLKHGIAAMRRRGGGSIINLSLTLARHGAPNMSANCAAAAGLRVMSQAAALECGEKSDGVRVNSILVDHTSVVASEVAVAVLYLASDESRFMTAGEIALNGDALSA
jgi:NAD(P)-dependent dehydrogenase (short-subunit alcohol dehydrogenase family)